MTRIRIDAHHTTQRLARETGLEKLGQAKLKPLADDKGVVSHTELERLARVADVDTDGVLSADERKRIDGYLKERLSPIVATPGGSAVEARAAAKKPVSGYLEVAHAVKGSDVVVDYDLRLDGKDGATEHLARQIVLKGITPSNDDAIDFHRYSETGTDSSVGYATGGVGAGYLMGIADAKRGVVLANLSAAAAKKNVAPELRTLFSPADLRADPAVKALARKEGLDPTKLKVTVTSVSFHSDFQEVTRAGTKPHATMHTLLLGLELREEGSRKKPREVQMTSLVTGNPAKGFEKLDAERLEAGVQARWGFIYPPSVKFDEDKPARNTGVRDTGGGGGGGESVTPTRRRRGGGGEHTVVTGGGGGRE
jgi:hypothetical protein